MEEVCNEINKVTIGNREETVPNSKQLSDPSTYLSGVKNTGASTRKCLTEHIRTHPRFITKQVNTHICSGKSEQNSEKLIKKFITW
jgi:hypothetical protein